jgi:hypothetical protein
MILRNPMTRWPDDVVVAARALAAPCAGCEDFLFSGQERPSAAAAGRRAGPVLAPLRAAGSAAAYTKGPDDRGRSSSGHRAPCKLIMLLSCPGRPSP